MGGFRSMTIALRDRTVRQLTSDGINEDPKWAPDSRHLVFTSNRTRCAAAVHSRRGVRAHATIDAGWTGTARRVVADAGLTLIGLPTEFLSISESQP